MLGLSLVIAVAAWIALAYWRDKHAIDQRFEDYRQRDNLKNAKARPR